MSKATTWSKDEQDGVQMKLYKLTDKDGRTCGGMQWAIGTTNAVSTVEHPELCTDDCIHAYANANLALLVNPIHAAYHNPRLWECEGEVVANDPLKVGTFSLTVIRELELPAWYGGLDVPIKFAQLCAAETAKWASYAAAIANTRTASRCAEESADAAECSAYAAETAKWASYAEIGIDFAALADKAVEE